jgi:hypothetical protein
MSFMQEAVREWAWIVGQDREDQQWILLIQSRTKSKI